MSNTRGSYFAPNSTCSFMATPIKGNLSGKRPNYSGMASVFLNDKLVGQSCHVESLSQCSSVLVASEIKGTCLMNALEVECFLDTGTSQSIISEEVWLRIKCDNEFSRVPERRVGELNMTLDEMLEAGVIVKSKSDWCSHTMCVPKRDGSMRLCIDYREVNKLTVRDSFEVPFFDVILNRVSNLTT